MTPGAGNTRSGDGDLALMRSGDVAPPSAELREGLRALVLRLEPQLDELAAELTSLYREVIPRYAEVPADDILAGTRAVLRVWADGVRSGRLPTGDDRAAIERYVERWTTMLLPLELIARSFQIGARRVVALAERVTEDLGFGTATLLGLQDHAWQWATLNMAVVGDVQRSQQVAAARRDGALRAALLGQLRAGRSSPEELADIAGLLGLDPEHGYVAVVGLPDGQGRVEASLRRSGATSALRVVHAVVDGRLFALAPGEPRLDPADGVTLGIGRRRAIDDAHLSFAEAEHALRTALAFGVEGLVDLEALAPLPVVTSTERLAEHAAGRRFAQLDALGASGEDVEQTVLAFFEHDQSIDSTARTLQVHRNTVRHRLGRFRELTGLDVAHTDEFVTAWWLLRHRQSRQALAGGDEPG